MYKLDVTYTRQPNCRVDFNDEIILAIIDHLDVTTFENEPRRVRIVAHAEHWLELETAINMLQRKLSVGRYTTMHPKKPISKEN